MEENREYYVILTKNIKDRYVKSGDFVKVPLDLVMSEIRNVDPEFEEREKYSQGQPMTRPKLVKSGLTYKHQYSPNVLLRVDTLTTERNVLKAIIPIPNFNCTVKIESDNIEPVSLWLGDTVPETVELVDGVQAPSGYFKPDNIIMSNEKACYKFIREITDDETRLFDITVIEEYSLLYFLKAIKDNMKDKQKTEELKSSKEPKETDVQDTIDQLDSLPFGLVIDNEEQFIVKPQELHNFILMTNSTALSIMEDELDIEISQEQMNSIASKINDTMFDIDMSGYFRSLKHLKTFLNNM